MRALQKPHHDGSGLYLSTAAPEIGEEVEFKIRIPKGFEFKAAFLRIYQDREPRFFQLRKLKEQGDENWWSASAEVINTITRYRFLFTTEDSYLWLNAAGLFSNDVTSAHDFHLIARPAHPSWLASSVFYQIFPDRFAKSDTVRTPESWMVPRQWNQLPQGKSDVTGVEYFGGDLDGVSEKLNYLEKLGINGIYFTPIFPAGSTHRYDATSFSQVDPMLGGDAALAKLRQESKQRSIRLVGDLTTNHCGVKHEWFVAAKEKYAKENEFFYWTDSAPHGYEGWWGLASLPKLNYGSQELRNRMYEGKDSVVKKWLKDPIALDGWRIDVGNMTGRYREIDINEDIVRGIRNAVDSANPDAWLLAENADHFAPDLDGLGWHGTMNYVGFMRPIWGWLKNNPDVSADFFGLPSAIPTFSTADFVNGLDDFRAMVPWRNFTASMLLLDSHDTARFRNVVGRSFERHLAGIALLMTYPGVPSIFMGDEIGLEGAWGEDARRTINWDDEQSWNHQLLDAFKELISLRKTSDALCNGGFRWVQIEKDVVVFLRESKQQRLLIAVARNEAKFKLDPDLSGFSFVHRYGTAIHDMTLDFSKAGVSISELFPNS